MDFTANEPTWWIAHGDGLGHGHLAPGAALTTGAEFFETFTDQQVFRSRLREIEADPAEARKTGAPTEPRARLAWIRWKREIGGITIPPGMHVRTTRDSQSQLTSALNSVVNGLVAPPIRWKLGSGIWVDLEADDLKGLTAAVSGHVKACFTAEEAVEGVLTAADDPATVDVEAEFEAAYAAAMG